jgi:hypothetical protein
MTAHLDDNGASLQPLDAEREGALEFTKIAATWFAVALLVAVLASCGAKEAFA